MSDMNELRETLDIEKKMSHTSVEALREDLIRAYLVPIATMLTIMHFSRLFQESIACMYLTFVT
jgi:hypothetical protein